MNRRQRREQYKKRKSLNTESRAANESGSVVWRALGKYEKSEYEKEQEKIVYVPGFNCPPEPTTEFKSQIENNIWHNRDQIDRFIEVLKRLSVEDDYTTWSWANNSRCKYVQLRFDMRDGGFIMTNDDGKRISIEQLEWQYKSVPK